MNDAGSSSDKKWSDSLKQFSATLVQGLEIRLDLLFLELKEEKQRLFSGLFLAMSAAFAAFLGFLCLNLLLMVLFWDTHRILVVVLMSVFYIAVALSIVALLRHRLRTEPEPFSATRGELQKDLSLIKGDES